MAEPIVRCGDEPLSLAEIENEVAAVREDLAARPANEDRTDLVAELGELLWNRYVALSESDDGSTVEALGEAIHGLEAARALATVDSPRWLDMTWWVAQAWIDHFGLSDDVRDLDRVASALEDLLARPVHDPLTEANTRGMLGQAYVVLSSKRGAYHRDRAIAELANALRLVHEHPDPEAPPQWWWTAVEAYGSVLAARWHAELNAPDLDEAIWHLAALAGRAQSADLPGEPATDEPGVLSELGRLLHDRAALRLAGSSTGEQLAGLADLDASVGWTAQAARMVGDDDPDLLAILLAAALAGWDLYLHCADPTVLSRVDDLYSRMLDVQDPDADGYAALVGLRTMVRAERLLHDGSRLDDPQWTAGIAAARTFGTDPMAHPLLDREDREDAEDSGPALPARLRGLLGIHDEYGEVARQRLASTVAGDPTRAGLAAMIAAAEVRALQHRRRDLDWRGLLELVELARAGLPEAGESLLVLGAVGHIMAAVDGEPGHAEQAIGALERAAAWPGAGATLEPLRAAARHAGGRSGNVHSGLPDWYALRCATHAPDAAGAGAD
jgi:hypothetical protein